MTQKDKDLLLKDLCSRLPYGVRMKGVNEDFELSTSASPKRLSYVLNSADFKPYLRPMSSMTEEERNELSHYDNSVQRTDFFYSHHIDCRFMIEKGLALAAPEDMYKF